MAFDRDAYLADVAVARKLARVRRLELYGMALAPDGRFEGMMRSPETPGPPPIEAEPLSSFRGVRVKVSQRQLL